MKTLLILFTVLTSVSFAQTNERYVVNKPTANVRSGPGTNYEIMATLSLNDYVTLIEKGTNGWWLIKIEESEGYILGSLLKKDPNNGWDKAYINSGETPGCENVIPEFNRDLDNYLKINVGSHTDVVVKLMRKSEFGEDVCIRIVFIRSNESYSIENIPEGIYYLKIAYGKDWSQKIINGQCYGKFMRDAAYSKGKERLDYNIIVGYNKKQVPSYQLNLDMIITRSKNGKTFNSNTISEQEFNK